MRLATKDGEEWVFISENQGFDDTWLQNSGTKEADTVFCQDVT